MILERELTPAQALKELLAAPRLRFGDPEQIDAVKTIRLAEQLIGTTRVCPECDGCGDVSSDEGGECDNCGRECSYCSGDELEECELCDGTGESTWTSAQVYCMLGKSIIIELNALKIEIAA